jgi:hypothetical protein
MSARNEHGTYGASAIDDHAAAASPRAAAATAAAAAPALAMRAFTGVGVSEDQAVIALELLTRVGISNADRCSIIWPLMYKHFQVGAYM